MTNCGKSWVQPRCIGCDRKPTEIPEYVMRFEEEGGYYKSPDDLVRRDEGTYVRATGRFWCTECYLRRMAPQEVAKSGVDSF